MEPRNILVNSSGQQSLNELRIDSYLSIAIFSLQDFLRWWYIKMPIWHLQRIVRISTVVDDQLSITLLIRNFFLPWHRDYSMIGYVFGILIKLLYLPITFIIYLLTMILSIIVLIIWLVLPIVALVYTLISLF